MGLQTDKNLPSHSRILASTGKARQAARSPQGFVWRHRTIAMRPMNASLPYPGNNPAPVNRKNSRMRRRQHRERLPARPHRALRRPVGKLLQARTPSAYESGRSFAIPFSPGDRDNFHTGNKSTRFHSNQGSTTMNFKTILASLVLSLALALPAFAAGQVDINSADAKTLAEGLNGVGLSKAEAIVAYRSEHGPFSSAEDLAQVKGIGEKLVEKNRDSIVVGGKTKSTASRKSAKADAKASAAE
jgi:competence protein ComEA